MKINELKKRNEYLEKENEHLSDLIIILMEAISSRDAEIKEYVETIKRVEKARSKVEHEFFKIPITRETHHSAFSEEHKEVVDAPKCVYTYNFKFVQVAEKLFICTASGSNLGKLFMPNKDGKLCIWDGKRFPVTFPSDDKVEIEYREKEVVDSSTNFSSRFMPNVKFMATEEQTGYIFMHFLNKYIIGLKDTSRCWFETDGDGNFEQIHRFSADCQKKEVSVFEAIPEFVPKGMVYDKSSDSLVKKD